MALGEERFWLKFFFTSFCFIGATAGCVIGGGGGGGVAEGVACLAFRNFILTVVDTVGDGDDERFLCELFVDDIFGAATTGN